MNFSSKKIKKEDIVNLQKEVGEVGKSTKNDKYEPTEEQKQRYNKDMSLWKSAITFRSEYDNKWQELVARYKAEPFYYEDGRAGVVLPIGKLIIETAQAQESKNPPSFAYSASDNKEDIAKATILDFVVKKHVWNRKYVDLDYKMDVLNQDKMILGTMYQYVGWRTLYRTVKTRDKNGNIEAKAEKFYDDIVVDNLYPQDVWLHPLATCVADSPWVFIRKRYDEATFLETYSDNKYFQNIGLVKAGSIYQGYDSGGETLWRDLADQKDTIIVIEKWDKMKDEVNIWANGVEIRAGENPYDDKELPLTDYRNRLQYNTYLGESEMERISTICDALNAFINIAIDKEKRSAAGLNLVDNNFSDFDDTAGIFSGTDAIRVENPKDSFVHYDMPGMSASTDKMIQMLMDFLVFATGIDFRQITDLASSTKATVAALRREISQQRINLNVNRNENCGIKRLGWLLAKRVQQFYTIPLVEDVTGQDLTGDKKVKNKKAVKAQYRELRIPDMEINEEEGPEGFNEESLRIKGVKEGALSFIQARPEYLRLKGDVTVKVIPGSTMGAIQELQKTKAQEGIKVATEVLKPAEQPGGSPTPWLSVKYFLEEWIKAMGYDVDKAFDISDKLGDTVAQDEGRGLVDSMSQSLGIPNPLKQNQQMGMIAGSNLPGQAPITPPSLTGQRSEPMREMQNDMSVASRITNKKQ